MKISFQTVLRLSVLAVIAVAWTPSASACDEHKTQAAPAKPAAPDYSDRSRYIPLSELDLPSLSVRPKVEAPARRNYEMKETVITGPSNKQSVVREERIGNTIYVTVTHPSGKSSFYTMDAPK